MEKIPATRAVEVSSRPSIDESQRQKSRKSLIERCQRIIFSAYRTDQYGDPEGYIDSLNLVFGQYPNEVIKYVSDPRTGVQRGCKWPPTIAEIVAACDARMGEIARLERLQNWGRQDEPKRLEAPREERPTLDELKAKYGENWGMDSLIPKNPPGFKTGQAKSWQDVISMYMREPERMAKLVAAVDGMSGELP
jgi:hypothetical protein